MDEHKRRWLVQAGRLGAGALLLPAVARAAELLPTTPPMDMGPFYPVRRPLEQDADLTRIAGHRARAKGEVIEVRGRVLNRDGTPVRDARIQLWQANAAGRYDHPSDHNDAPLDPDFQGSAKLVTKADGAFQFLTVMPGAYAAGDFMRARHIHFDISSSVLRLVTQMYFPDDPLLAKDRVFHHDVDIYKQVPTQVFGKPLPSEQASERGAKLFQYDIVLGPRFG
jgi:protocatechuate 3,4-dioxygenase, beta subunit